MMIAWRDLVTRYLHTSASAPANSCTPQKAGTVRQLEATLAVHTTSLLSIEQLAAMKAWSARFISIVGHPFVLFSLVVLSLPARYHPHSAVRSFVAFAAIVLLPLVAMIWYLRESGRWQTVDASNKEERPVLYVAADLTLMAAAMYYCFIEHAHALMRGCLAVIGMMLAAQILNRWVKLSLHVATALLCGLILLSVRSNEAWIVLGWIPLLIWSRLALRRHIVAEILGGLILGTFGAGCLWWLQAQQIG
ncbi:MAG: hypothetical protein INR62_01255 [Rhodospirillales bacterium]|nr:hypothetical protein [Acetobacter sp.]